MVHGVFEIYDQQSSAATTLGHGGTSQELGAELEGSLPTSGVEGHHGGKGLSESDHEAQCYNKNVDIFLDQSFLTRFRNMC